jgi:hypothetical protein
VADPTKLRRVHFWTRWEAHMEGLTAEQSAAIKDAVGYVYARGTTFRNRVRAALKRKRIRDAINDVVIRAFDSAALGLALALADGDKSLNQRRQQLTKQVRETEEALCELIETNIETAIVDEFLAAYSLKEYEASEEGRRRRSKAIERRKELANLHIQRLTDTIKTLRWLSRILAKSKRNARRRALKQNSRWLEGNAGEPRRAARPDREELMAGLARVWRDFIGERPGISKHAGQPTPFYTFADGILKSFKPLKVSDSIGRAVGRLDGDRAEEGSCGQ